MVPDGSEGKRADQPHPQHQEDDEGNDDYDQAHRTSLTPFLIVIERIVRKSRNPGEIILSHLQGPIKAEAATKSDPWKLIDAATGQLEWALSSNGRLEQYPD